MLELARFFLHPGNKSLCLIQLFLLRVFANILGDFHAAEMRTAHGAKMGQLGGIVAERLVIIGPRRFGIQGQIELILPAKFKTGLA